MNLTNMIEVLKAKGHSQADIARVTGYSEQYISDLAKGIRGKRPAHDLVTALTAFYNKEMRK